MRLLQILLLTAMVIPLSACHTVLQSRVENPYSYLKDGELAKLKGKKTAKAERAELNLTGHPKSKAEVAAATAAKAAKSKPATDSETLTKMVSRKASGAYSIFTKTLTNITGEEFWQ